MPVNETYYMLGSWIEREYIAETSYPACCASTPPPVVGYPATEAGQLSYISDVSLLRV